MASRMTSLRRVRIVTLGMVLSIVTSAAPARAGGGNVLPPTARPHGYSLTDMASATAIFNSGLRDTQPPPTPFQMLYQDRTHPENTTFRVKPGTMLYVPVVFYTDSPPVPPDFPDLSNARDVRDFFFNPSRFGVTNIEIDVDGQPNFLGPDYLAAVTTEQPLQDGVPGGHHYIGAAAFLTPLTKGCHTVRIQASAEGPDTFGPFVFELTYTVIVP
jgi:hypothetical protein